MRARHAYALLTAACLLLAACSSSSADEPSEAKPPVATSPTAEPTASPSPKELSLGQPTVTVGDGGTGELEVTPTTLVYAKKGGGETPQYGVFAVVTVKDRASGAVAAEEPPPVSGGGWQWIAPSGEAVEKGGGTSFNVVLDKFNGAGEVQPGSFQWHTVVFDLTPEQAKGGTLVYTDGNETAYRWKVPATDTGPQISEVKKQLEF